MSKLWKAAALALALATSATGVAGAGQEPFGKDIAGWSFTQEKEPGGLTNCRAHITVRGQLNILAMRTNREGYASVPAAGITGTFANSVLEFGGLTVTVLGKVHGDRLTFSTLDEGAMNIIATDGAYKWRLPGKDGASGTADLGRKAGEAVARLLECVSVNS